MTPVLLAFAGASAVVDWFAVQRGNKQLEYLTKPLTLVLLIVVAVTAWDEAGDAAPWLVAALVFSLGGDVFLMLPRDLFVAGLASFLIAHVCYIVAFGPEVPEGTTEWIVVGLLVVVGAFLFARLVAGLRERKARELIAPVAAYSVAITAMLYAAVTYSPLAGLGAGFFYVSDSLIGWTRFVTRLRYGDIAIIVTYHVAQVLLVLAFVS